MLTRTLRMNATPEAPGMRRIRLMRTKTTTGTTRTWWRIFAAGSGYRWR